MAVEDYDQDEDIYSAESVENLLEDDELSVAEEGFMQGYDNDSDE